jgi:hypothetical protein
MVCWSDETKTAIDQLQVGCDGEMQVVFCNTNVMALP